MLHVAHVIAHVTYLLDTRTVMLRIYIFFNVTYLYSLELLLFLNLTVQSASLEGTYFVCLEAEHTSF